MTLTTTTRARLQSGFCFAVTTDSGQQLLIDAAPESGGADRGPRPMELLPAALATCTAITVLSILRKKRLQIMAYEVVVQSERVEDHPRVFTAFHVEHRITGALLAPQVVQRAIELTEARYCGVSAMLRAQARITHSFSLVEPESPTAAPQQSD
jgi:putative redox protein